MFEEHTELMHDRKICCCEIDISGVHYASASNTFLLKPLGSSRFSIHIHGTLPICIPTLGARRGSCRERKSLAVAKVPCFCSTVRSVLKNTLECIVSRLRFGLNYERPRRDFGEKICTAVTRETPKSLIH